MAERIRDVDIAWAAGFIDGEGCFILAGKGAPRIDVGQKDIRPLFRLRELFGGSISLHPANRHGLGKLWQWRISNQGCLQALDALLPYLVLKREQAELLLTIRPLLRSRSHRGTKLSTFEIGQRQEIKTGLSLLKRSWSGQDAAGSV